MSSQLRVTVFVVIKLNLNARINGLDGHIIGISKEKRTAGNIVHLKSE